MIFNQFQNIVPKFLLEIVQSSSRAFKSLLSLYCPSCIRSKNGSGRLLLHHAATDGLEWENGCKAVLKENVLAVKEQDGQTGLFPFMLAAAGETTDLSSIYGLLREYPQTIY